METKEIIEYQMSKDMFDALVKTKKGKDAKKNNWQYVTDIVNAEYGLKGHCVRVVVDR